LKIATANTTLNVLGGVLMSITGLIGWGYAAWAAVTPLPEKPAITTQTVPDQAACRSHASDLGFRRFVARVGTGGASKSHPLAPAGLHFAADQEPTSEEEAEELLENASALITRCAMKLEYMCMGEVCTKNEGSFMRISLDAGAPVKEAATK